MINEPLHDPRTAPAIRLPTALLATFLATFLAAAVAAPGAGQALKKTRDGLVLSTDGSLSVVEDSTRRVTLPLSLSARVNDFRTGRGRAGGREWWVAALGRRDGAPVLELVHGTDRGVELLPSPVLEPAAQLGPPVLLTDDGGLRALAWLDGEAHDRHGVLAARWLGDGWDVPEVVSPPGKGTQIALSAAVLGDGSWLLAWAAYDGEDDEILWSRNASGTWSAPRPAAADNRVPDISPHLYPTADGALLAWSRYDGNDYRVNVARFDGAAFSPPAVIGPKGSTAPTFSDGEHPYLIYLLAHPRAWAVMELDSAGNVLRTAEIESADPQRPILGEVSPQQVVLQWATGGERSASAALHWSPR